MTNKSTIQSNILANIKAGRITEVTRLVHTALMQKVATALPEMKKEVSKKMFNEDCGEKHDKEDLEEATPTPFVVVHTKKKIIVAKFKNRNAAKKKVATLGKEYTVASADWAEDSGFKVGKINEEVIDEAAPRMRKPKKNGDWDRQTNGSHQGTNYSIFQDGKQFWASVGKWVSPSFLSTKGQAEKQAKMKIELS